MPHDPHVVLAHLPQLAAADVRLLWVNDWYDGPVEAVVELAGERYLMVLDEGPVIDLAKQVHWVLFRLSPEQWLEEDHWHALFESVIGHHWCFHHEQPEGDADSGEPAEPADPKLFYEPFGRRAPRIMGAPLGWVDELPVR